ncbi:Rhodanese-related sulfurtransferase [Opitutaceae bacterium TAV1]|nr:sulfurtransferase [Opitutaceae bacterium TAV5]EIQ01296.1 Rhodanese-related sulfurtransferase [Opitutaceae bacterium TAV1]
MSRFRQLIDDTRTRIREIGTADLAALLAGSPPPVLLDVRETDEFAKGHLPGARHVSRGVLEGNIEDIVPDPATPVVLYCASGNRSALAADNLQRMGYRDVVSLAGGYKAWVAEKR